MLEVVRSFPEFRRLWLAQVASNGGDWLSRVAVLTLIGQLSGAREAAGVGALYGVELALRLLPTTVLGPIAGPIADRLPRKLLMIGADFVRAALVLSLLLVREAGDLPYLYIVVALQMGTGIFFDSAKSGALPNTLPKEHLHAAYALSAATWSTMLSVGALTGGFLVELIGIQNVFVLDAGTYLVSAALVARLNIPRYAGGRSSPPPMQWSDLLLFKDLRKGFAHVREKHMLAPVLAKTFWGPAGGFLALLSIVASERFEGRSGFGSTGFAVGIFFSARGVGTAVGPILARRFIGSTDAQLCRQIAGGFVVGAIGYAYFAVTESLALAVVSIVVSHMGGSTIWVASTTLWQKHVDDEFRGRAFSLEFFGMTFAFAMAGLLTGFLYDATDRIDWTTWSVCGAVLLMGAAWTALARRFRTSGD